MVGKKDWPNLGFLLLLELHLLNLICYSYRSDIAIDLWNRFKEEDGDGGRAVCCCIERKTIHGDINMTQEKTIFLFNRNINWYDRNTKISSSVSSC